MQLIAFLSLLRLIGHIKRIVQHSQGALSWLHLIPFLAVSARQSEDVFLPHKLLSPALGLECVVEVEDRPPIAIHITANESLLSSQRVD